MDIKEYKKLAIQSLKKSGSHDLPNQKFPRGTWVKVDDHMPITMRFFPKGFTGIVEYTYGQKYGDNDINNYSIVQLNENGEAINCIAWYHEDQLTLLNDDIKSGMIIINNYRDGD